MPDRSTSGVPAFGVYRIALLDDRVDEHLRQEDPAGRVLTIRYLMSTGCPYQVQVVETHLESA
jgi:hypothetical protein